MENVVSKRFEKELDLNEVITAENVVHMGEMIAVSAVKKMLPYSGNALYGLYAGLVHDVFDYKDISEPYSDGYDLAQAANCFLCEHLGKTLNDIYTKDKKGREITIRWACYRQVYKEIYPILEDAYNTVSFESLTPRFQPYTTELEMSKDNEAENDRVEEIIERMNLTPGQKETLLCYMGGMRFVETARFLSVNIATIWKRRHQLKIKYNKYIANYER